MPLTDAAIKGLRPQEKSYKVVDGNGLYIEVLKTGTKVWRFKYRFGGKEKRLTIGEYPTVSLKSARLLLIEAKQHLTRGIDPSANKKAEREQTDVRTFASVGDEWMLRQAPKWSEHYKDALDARLRRFVYPQIGTLDIKDIQPKTVLDFVRRIEGEGKTNTAYRVLGVCSLIFRYGVTCGYCTSDPCRDLRGALTARMVKSRAALTEPKEVGRLMANIELYAGGIVMRMALKWSALTFCRPGEVRKAEWSEIDFEKRVWKIPAEKMKMRKEHRVPLSRQCMEILDTLRALNFSQQWIFPSVRVSRPISQVGVLTALRLMGYEKDDMCAHGFRAMASTLLNEQGWDSDVIEIQLAHVDKNSVRAVYNRAQYWSKRVEMMQAWADYLDKLKQEALQSLSFPG